MVERKAEISLDEWLERVPVHSEASETSTTAAESKGVPNPSSTPDTSPSEVKDEVVVGNPADVAPAEGDSSEWFWLLLEQTGYERW